MSTLSLEERTRCVVMDEMGIPKTDIANKLGRSHYAVDRLFYAIMRQVVIPISPDQDVQGSAHQEMIVYWYANRSQIEEPVYAS